MSHKQKVANRRNNRVIRDAIKMFAPSKAGRAASARADARAAAVAATVKGALWEAIRPFGRVKPKYYDSNMGDRPKRGDIVIGRYYFIDMADPYARAAVALARAANVADLVDLIFHLDAEKFVCGVTRFTMASTAGFDTMETRREGVGDVHHTVRANARRWRDACRQAGGDAAYSATEWAYDSDRQVGLVPHGHSMAMKDRDGNELYPAGFHLH